MASIPSRIKIGIVGPECCGKTTLATDLSTALGYTLIPEYSRLHFASKKTPYYTIEDIITIAQGQLQQENAVSQPIVCDTHLLVCKIWAEVKFSYCPAWIDTHYAPHSYVIHFLTAPDIPWQSDPLREHPHTRAQLFSSYEADLQRSQVKYAIVSGNRAHRLQTALHVLGQLGLA